jgi:NADH-quinone oxidoreductase subunit F
MALGEFDKSGRRTPVPIAGSEFEIEIDTLIPAIGQKPDLDFGDGAAGLKATSWGTLEVDPETMATQIDGVFAGGDVVSGPGTVLEAMGMGKTAAAAVHRYLRGENPAPVYFPTEPRLEVPAVELDEADWALERPDMPVRPVAERIGSFAEVELGYSEKQAVSEARRCLRCDLESLRRKGETTHDGM